jgi:hypothetical protein
MAIWTGPTDVNILNANETLSTNRAIRIEFQDSPVAAPQAQPPQL